MSKSFKKTSPAESQSPGASVYNKSEKYKLTKVKVEANLKVSFKKGTTREQIAELNLDILRSFVNYLSDFNPVQFNKLQYSSNLVTRDDEDFESVSIISTIQNAATGGVNAPIGGGGSPHKIVTVNPKILFEGLSKSSKKLSEFQEGNGNVK